MVLEYITGNLVPHNFLHFSVKQVSKNYMGEQSSFPQDKPVLGYTAEGLYQ